VAQQQRWPDDTIVVNVQGDEPLIPPAVINQVAENLFHARKASVATLCERITDTAVFLDPNAVKVVFDDEGYALYFSRAPIPWPRDAFKDSKNSLPKNHAAFRHIGIYAYRVAFLHQFVQWSPTVLEQTESLEQLRALAHGMSIHVQEACETVPGGVDTEADLAQARSVIPGMH
jgi:3-deoxy-manno-octulosonate cytidylyltransferase (CMP-KDO synthetase)